MAYLMVFGPPNLVRRKNPFRLRCCFHPLDPAPSPRMKPWLWRGARFQENNKWKETCGKVLKTQKNADVCVCVCFFWGGNFCWSLSCFNVDLWHVCLRLFWWEYDKLASWKFVCVKLVPITKQAKLFREQVFDLQIKKSIGCWSCFCC